jgi:MFS family permease
MVPISLADSIPVMAVCAGLVGCAISPTLIAGNGLVQALVPPAAITEGFTWVSTSLVVGIALGLPVAGWMIDRAGGSAGFLVALAAGAVAVVLAFLGRGYLYTKASAPPEGRI